MIPALQDFTIPLHWDKVFRCINSLLVGCSRIQELMSKIFAGLTGRCQHPSLCTKSIPSATEPAMEKQGMQRQVPGECCVWPPPLMPQREAHAADCGTPAFLPFTGWEFIRWQISQQRLESRWAGICTQSIHPQLAELPGLNVGIKKTRSLSSKSQKGRAALP